MLRCCSTLLHLAHVEKVNSKGKSTGTRVVGLEDIEKLRPLSARAPGHPEYRHATGAEAPSGQWTIEEAVPVNLLSAPLFARYRSRVGHGFGDKMLAAMCLGLGGHVEIPQ